MIGAEAFADWLTARRAALTRRRHRGLVCLCGSRQWARTLAASIDGAPDSVWIGDPPPDSAHWRVLPVVRVRDLLGGECELAVWDVHCGFDPDGFGALSGAIRGGGLLLLLAPPLENWAHWPDPQHRRIAVDGYPSETIAGRFLARFARCVAEDRWSVVIRESDTSLPSPPDGSSAVDSAPGAAAGTEQNAAVDAILRVALGHRRRPLVITADRGRGKSAALGMAAARLSRERPGARILLTAPRREQAEAVYRHADGVAPTFLLPTDLAARKPEADLVLVDEAAGISPAILHRLLRLYSRIVFSTTVHGYEGTGRGFAIRFRRKLDEETPAWRELQLTEPIRWAAGDPLESLTFRALMLDATAAPCPATGKETATFELLDRDQLARDDALLGQVFGLLVQAHYRTRPMDLRNLLDGPNLQVHVVRMAARVVGVALVAVEGGVPVGVAEEIWLGRRRPQGHLLPQALAAHVGLRRGAMLRAARVMRIAVHPECQRRGIGSALLDAVSESAAGFDAALIGASFGATPDVLAFWWRNGLLPVRLGMRRDAASGTHSALVVRALARAGDAPMAQARARFARELPLHLVDALADVEPAVTEAILASLPVVPPPTEDDWQDLAAFAEAARAYETTLAALNRFAWWTLTTASVREHLQPEQRHLLVVRLLQCRSWQASAEVLGLPGRGGVIDALRAVVRHVAAVGGVAP